MNDKRIVKQWNSTITNCVRTKKQVCYNHSLLHPVFVLQKVFHETRFLVHGGEKFVISAVRNRRIPLYAISCMTKHSVRYGVKVQASCRSYRWIATFQLLKCDQLTRSTF